MKAEVENQAVVFADPRELGTLAREMGEAYATAVAFYVDRYGMKAVEAQELAQTLVSADGEVALLAFTYASYPNPGIAVILLAATLIGPKTLTLQWERYLWQAYRRGTQADLDFARYEDWLPLPLEEVRRKASIVPPEEAHPGIGIVEGSRESGRGTAFLLRS